MTSRNLNFEPQTATYLRLEGVHVDRSNRPLASRKGSYHIQPWQSHDVPVITISPFLSKYKLVKTMLIHWLATNVLNIRNGGRLEFVSSDIVFTELMICKDVGTND